MRYDCVQLCVVFLSPNLLSRFHRQKEEDKLSAIETGLATNSLWGRGGGGGRGGADNIYIRKINNQFCQNFVV